MPLQDDTYLSTGNVTVPTGLNNGWETIGIGPMGRIQVYDIVPLTLQTNNVAAVQTPSPTNSALTLAAGTGTTATTVAGVSVIALDVPRNLSFTSGGNDSGITYNVVGYDVYKAPMTENVTGGNATIARGAKAWMYVASITPSGNIAGNISVGTDDTFGLPFYLSDKTYVLGVQWNNTLAKDTGTLTVGVTTTPSHTTGDVRGTYKPNSGASDGTKRLVFSQVISAAQVGPSATSAAVLGKTQA